MRPCFLLILLAASNVAVAFSDFKCVVKDSIYLENDGSLNHKTNLATAYIGKEFTVNRSSGLISGGGLTNSMSGIMPSVYDYRPKDNGYKAVTHYKPNNTIDYLQINQFTEGNEKPFFFKGAFGTMVSGICRAY
ncbi:MAG: hypothetical protein K6L81_01700 [Agarilytica sp.]